MLRSPAVKTYPRPVGFDLRIGCLAVLPGGRNTIQCDLQEVLELEFFLVAQSRGLLPEVLP